MRKYGILLFWSAQKRQRILICRPERENVKAKRDNIKRVNGSQQTEILKMRKVQSGEVAPKRNRSQG